jgi:hypothetical protein
MQFSGLLRLLTCDKIGVPGHWARPGTRNPTLGGPVLIYPDPSPPADRSRPSPHQSLYTANTTMASCASPSWSASTSSDTTMLDAPPSSRAPARTCRPSQGTSASSTSLTRRSSNGSPFSLLLSLPRELRDRVYHYALVLDRPVYWPHPPFSKSNIGYGLLTTSRQVYEEAAPILYSANKFLFSHPSDCTMFRVVASSKYSENISCAYLRIRDKDLRLWTTYLGSRRQGRCLKNDLPKLKTLWIYLSGGTPIGQSDIAPLRHPHASSQVLAAHHAIRHHFQAQHQDVPGDAQAAQATVQDSPPATQQSSDVPGDAQATQATVEHSPPETQQSSDVPLPSAVSLFPEPMNPEVYNQLYTHYFPPLNPHRPHGPPNDPAGPSLPFAAHNRPGAQYRHYRHQFNRVRGPLGSLVTVWEREIGLESLCNSLQETRPVNTQVKIVCVLRLPITQFFMLCDACPDELTISPGGNARTEFRKLLGLDVSLELTNLSIARRSWVPTQPPVDVLLDRLT